MPIFDVSLSDLRRRTSMKWRRYDPDILPAWVAEMDCELAPAVRQALQTAIAIGDTGYPEGADYQHAFAEFAAARWNWTFAPGDAVTVPDVMQGISRVLEILTAPNSHVVVNSPVYNCFYGYLPWANRGILDVPLGADNRLDLDALAEAFAGNRGPKPEAYLLCSPHNPTGTQHSHAELARIAELAQTHGVRVISDEIHAPLVATADAFVPYLTVPGTTDAVTVTSASKAWNLAGLKAAIAVGGTASAAALRTLPDEVTHNPSHLGVISHVSALRDGRDWLDQLIDEIAANQKLFATLLAERLPQLRYHNGGATFLAWVDCSALDQPNPARFFRANGRVALSDGAAFGSGSDQFVRVNLATSPTILTEIVDRMATALSALR